MLTAAFLIEWEPNAWAIFGLVVYLLALLSIPSVLLKRRGRPQAALGWVMVLFFVPGLGLFLWWAIGRRHLVRRRRRRRLAAEKLSLRLTELRAELPAVPEADWDVMPFRCLPSEEAEWAFAPTTGNQVELLVDAEQAYPAIEQMIADATHHIHILFYIWQNDATGRHFRDLLIEKARAGVEVRLLFDAVGGSNVRRGGFMDPLRASGAQVAAFMPPRIFKRSLDLNFRNHRKIVVADGCCAFVGGLNIGDEYRENWHDTGVKLQGPVVDQLQEVFADDWHFATGEDFTQTGYFAGGCGVGDSQPGDGHPSDGQAAPRERAICGIVASGPHSEFNFTREAFFIALNNAKKRIWITTPYFIPDQSIMASIRSAVFRGVDVRMLVPARGDHLLVHLAGRSYYPDLLRSGVRIFEYRGAVLHAKTVVLDDDLSIVGSANMDIRSFRLNFEVNCFVKCGELTAQLAELFERDLGKSRETSLAEVEQTSYVQRLGEAVAHLLSPLL